MIQTAPKKSPRLVLVIEIAAVIAVTTVTLLFMSKSIRKSVYSERKELLTLVTNTAADIINENIAANWLVNDFIRTNIVTSFSEDMLLEDMLATMQKRYAHHGDIIFLVDEDGKYYSGDGSYGKLADLSNYTMATADKSEYLGTLPHLDQQATHLVFRERLYKPFPVRTLRGPATIAWYACAHDLTELNRKITALYPGASNIFINDSDGIMLYREFGIKMLIDGYNGFAKFKKCEFPFGETAESVTSACRKRESVVFLMRIKGQDYYLCTSPLKVLDWALTMVVHASDMDRMSNNAVSSTILHVSLLVLILGGVLLFAVYSVMKSRRDKERLAATEQLAAAMSEASKAKSDFLSNMSHDIRTPINGIMGMTTIAMGVPGNPEKTAGCLKKIDGASHHLLSLINDVLDMSRIERGKTTITTAPADIRTICDNCCSVVGGQLENRDVEFIHEVIGEHTRVYADELHLRQIFINILGNAIKFTRDGGKIWFRCEEVACTANDVTYRFVFKDTGIGMSREFQTRIFDAFSQEDGVDRSKYKGTGLGMSISKKLVDLMDGTIEVESEIEKGSTFTVTITFARDLNKKAEAVRPVADMKIDGLKILLAEDNDLNLEIATELLQGEGVTVDAARDGMQAVEKFKVQPAGTYDAILMDVMMPRMNGLEATRAIRALDRADAKSIPIIAMTANAFEDDVKATRDAGMNEHLSKPINIREVTRVLAYFHSRGGEKP